MAITDIFAYDGVHGTAGSYNQWKPSGGLLAGFNSSGTDCRCVWAFDPAILIGITDPIKSIKFKAYRDDAYSAKTLRCWISERTQNPVSSISWSTTQDWAQQITNIGQGWLEVDLTSQVNFLKAIPSSSSILVGLMQHSGTANNYTIWTWGSNANKASFRAYIEVETHDGVMWYNDNGTWRRCAIWYNDNGTWKRCRAHYNNGGVWKMI